MQRKLFDKIADHLEELILIGTTKELYDSKILIDFISLKPKIE